MARTNPVELLKIQTRDPETLKEVVRLNTGHLYKACLGMGFSNPESEDLTQNVWVTFFDVAPRFEGQSTVRTFLFGILYNKASEMRKQNSRAEASDEIDKIMDAHFDSVGHWIGSPMDPETFLYSSQVLGLISKCLERLPLLQKMAFTLKEIEEAATEEICSLLKITNTHLGVTLFRARNQLRECIESKSKRA